VTKIRKSNQKKTEDVKYTELQGLAVELVAKEVHKKFGNAALMKMGDSYREQVDVISTGSWCIDDALGVGGLPRGRIVEIFGAEASGKTTLALGVVANAQRDGGLAAFIDAEHALDISLVSSVGANPNELYISQPDYGEQGLEILHMLVSSGQFAVIVVDSVAALVPKAELDGEMDDVNMGLQARLMGRGLRKLSGVVSKSNTLVIFVNQIRQKIGVFFGSPETTPGGNALKFFASVRIDIRRESPIKAPDGSVLGNKLKVTIVKNKVAPPFKTAHTELLFGKGIQLSSELLDIGVEGGIIEQRGSCLYFEDKRIGQGRQDALHTLAENPDILSVLKKRLIDLRSQNAGAQGIRANIQP